MALEEHMEDDGGPPCALPFVATMAVSEHALLQDWVICLLGSGVGLLWSMLGIQGEQITHNNKDLLWHLSVCLGNVLNMMNFVVVWSGIG